MKPEEHTSNFIMTVSTKQTPRKVLSSSSQTNTSHIFFIKCRNVVILLQQKHNVEFQASLWFLIANAFPTNVLTVRELSSD